MSQKKRTASANLTGRLIGVTTAPFVWGWIPMLGLGAVHDDFAAVPALGYWATAGVLLAVQAVGSAWRPFPLSFKVDA